MSLLVFENMDRSRQRKMFTIFGVDYFITNRTWINIPLMLSVGIILALIFSPEDQISLKILSGVGYGLLIILSSFCHGIGHIISSSLVDAPISSIIMTATVNVIHFDDNDEMPSRVHVGRSLGGPLFNLLLGLMAIGIYEYAVQNHYILFFGWVNIIFGVFTLLPIQSLDGPVIFREIKEWKR